MKISSLLPPLPGAVVVAVVGLTTTGLDPAMAWSFSSSPSSRSSFLGSTQGIKMTKSTRQATSSSLNWNNGLVMYNSPADPPNSNSNSNNKNGGAAGHDAWTVLAKTEQWISETLQASNSPSPPSSMDGGMKKNGPDDEASTRPASSVTPSSSSSFSSNSNISNNSNPYSRKEVSYLYESSPELLLIVAGIWRRLKEARVLGETHGKSQRKPPYSTVRQTQVVVMPSNADLRDSFTIFDALIESINQARRRARDLILSSENDDSDDDDMSSTQQWSVAVNCAHLHPQFGVKTPEEELAELKEQEKEESSSPGGGEVDLNYQAYQEKRLQARRSPYPTIVIEVRASPAPNFGAAPKPQQPPTQENLAAAAADDASESKVTAEDIAKLEALFGKSPAFRDQEQSSKKKRDDDFYDALASHFDSDDNRFSSRPKRSPLEKVQDYFNAKGGIGNPATTAFTESEARQVDEAYEFVFSNLAMMASEEAQRQQSRPGTTTTTRSYLVCLPHFCSKAATSLEKFCSSVSAIVSTIQPSLSQDIMANMDVNIEVEPYHPEHVDASRRSPHPVVALKWTTSPTTTNKKSNSSQS